MFARLIFPLYEDPKTPTLCVVVLNWLLILPFEQIFIHVFVESQPRVWSLNIVSLLCDVTIDFKWFCPREKKPKYLQPIQDSILIWCIRGKFVSLYNMCTASCMKSEKCNFSSSMFCRFTTVWHFERQDVTKFTKFDYMVLWNWVPWLYRNQIIKYEELWKLNSLRKLLLHITGSSSE